MSLFFFSDIGAVLLDKNGIITPEIITRFKWAQFINSTFSFIIPALLFGYFSSPRPLPYLGLQRHFSVSLVVLCIVLLFTVQPFVGWLGNLNAQANFGSLQSVFKESEELHNRAMKSFLIMKTPTDLLINLLLMALLPAIGEELFFRGSLQKVLLRMNGKPWLAILISSAIFALMHSTFFKILPIFVLGILIGAIYYVTQNLWYCILIHLINNTLAVLSIYYADKSEIWKKLAGDYNIPIYTALISLVVSLAIIYFIKKRSASVFAVAPVDDDQDFIA
jgi:membrane protease YdiL (CAAX protease family)